MRYVVSYPRLSRRTRRKGNARYLLFCARTGLAGAFFALAPGAAAFAGRAGRAAGRALGAGFRRAGAAAAGRLAAGRVAGADAAGRDDDCDLLTSVKRI